MIQSDCFCYDGYRTARVGLDNLLEDLYAPASTEMIGSNENNFAFVLPSM